MSRLAGRYWGDDSGSDDDSDRSDESSSEREVQTTGARGWNDLDDDSEDESEEESRVVIRKEDRRLEEIDAQVASISNTYLKIKDWSNVSANLSKLLLFIKKNRSVLESTGIPTSFIKLVIRLEADTGAVTRAMSKKLSKASAKSLTKIKRAVKDLLKEYDDQITEEKTNPTEDKKPEDSSDDDSDATSTDDPTSEDDQNDGAESATAAAAAAAKASPKKSVMSSDDDDDDDDSDFDDSSSEESTSESLSDSSEDEDEGTDGKPTLSRYQRMRTREFWLKKPTDKDDEFDTDKKHRKTLASLEDLMQQARKNIQSQAGKEGGTASGSLKVVLKKLGRQLKKAQNTIRFQKAKESDSESDYSDDDDEFEEEIDEALQKQATQAFEAAKKVIADLEAQISSLSSTSSAAVAEPEQSKFIFTNSRDFLQKLNEMQQMRGRRNSDRDKLLSQLQCMRSSSRREMKFYTGAPENNAETVSARGKNLEQKDQETLFTEPQFIPKLEIMVLNTILATIFDAGRQRKKALQSTEWHLAMQSCVHLMDLLEQNPQLRIVSVVDLDDEEAHKRYDLTRTFGGLLHFVECLTADFVKSLKMMQSKMQQYAKRLPDQAKIEHLIRRMLQFHIQSRDRLGKGDASFKQVEHENESYSAALALALLRLQYYIHDTRLSVWSKTNQHLQSYNWNPAANQHPASKDDGNAKAALVESFCSSVINPASLAVDVPAPEVVPHYTVDQLAAIIYAEGDDSQIVYAVLCQVYHLALHDHFRKAKTLLLMSDIQKRIGHQQDVNKQIYYNRALAQMGMCAFRQGRFQECLHCLAELCSGSRLKELLAQSIVRDREKDDEAMYKEEARLLPAHLHINLELLESCHLTAAMLLEMPTLAAETAFMYAKHSRRVLSRGFRKLLFNYEHRKAENNIDKILVAAQAIGVGNWRKCASLVVNLKCWNMWRLYGIKELKTLLREKIKTTALRTYLLKFNSQYASLKAETLSAMFNLDNRAVHSVVNRMMLTKELSASWDQSTNSILLYTIKPTQLQERALHLGDRITDLVNANNKLVQDATGKPFEGHDRKWDSYQSRRGPSEFGRNSYQRYHANDRRRDYLDPSERQWHKWNKKKW